LFSNNGARITDRQIVEIQIKDRKRRHLN
jgi:hypothetical protein